MIESDDTASVRRCLNGSRDAFAELVHKYQRAVFNTALRIVGDYDEACDVAQTVFIKAWEKLYTFNPKFKFFSWIYRMTVNESINAVHHRKRTQSLVDAATAEHRSPEGDLLADELSRGVQRAIMQLPLHYRLVVVLRHFRDLSYRQMSITLRIPEKTVKSRLFTARRLLCEIFQREGVVVND